MVKNYVHMYYNFSYCTVFLQVVVDLVVAARVVEEGVVVLVLVAVVEVLFEESNPVQFEGTLLDIPFL